MKKLVDIVFNADDINENFSGELQLFSKKDIFKLPLKGTVINDEDWIKLNDKNMEKAGVSITSKRVKIIQKLN